jgi:hypothetical protein
MADAEHLPANRALPYRNKGHSKSCRKYCMIACALKSIRNVHAACLHSYETKPRLENRQFGHWRGSACGEIDSADSQVCTRTTWPFRAFFPQQQGIKSSTTTDGDARTPNRSNKHGILHAFLQAMAQTCAFSSKPWARRDTGKRTVPMADFTLFVEPTRFVQNVSRGAITYANDHRKRGIFIDIMYLDEGSPAECKSTHCDITE